VALWILGVALWLCTKTLFSNSLIDDAHLYGEAPRPSSAALVARVLLASWGSLCHIVAVWTLVDEYAWEDTPLRNTCYLAAGAAMMGAGGTLSATALVSPIQVLPHAAGGGLGEGATWQSAMLHMGFSLPSKPARALRSARLGVLSEVVLTEHMRRSLSVSADEERPPSAAVFRHAAGASQHRRVGTIG
jgi:hypothetical protein